MLSQLKPKPFTYFKSSEALLHEVLKGTKIIPMQMFYDVQGPPVVISQLENGAGGGESSGHYSAVQWHGIASLALMALVKCSDPASVEADRWPPWVWDLLACFSSLWHVTKAGQPCWVKRLLSSVLQAQGPTWHSCWKSPEGCRALDVGWQALYDWMLCSLSVM